MDKTVKCVEGLLTAELRGEQLRERPMPQGHQSF